MKKSTKFSQISLFVLPLLTIVPDTSHAENFEGPYVGVEAGAGVLKTTGTTLGGPVDLSESSGLVSGVLGYRSPVTENGRFFLGVEGVFGLYTSGTNWHYGVSGIGGYRVGEKGLAYVRVGYGVLKGVQTGAGNQVSGLVLGGGYEVALHKKINLRLDYRNLNYGEVNFTDNSVDFDGHEITAAVLFSF